MKLQRNTNLTLIKLPAAMGRVNGTAPATAVAEPEIYNVNMK